MRTPRASVVARMFLDGESIGWIAVKLRCEIDQVEQALRRAFIAAEKRRRR